MRLKIAAFFWAVFICSICILAFLKPSTFDTSIMALLPKNEQKQSVAEVQQAQASNYAKHIFIMISAPQKEVARQAVKESIQKLLLLNDILEVTSSNLTEIKTKALFDYRFALLEMSVRESLKEGDYDSQYQFALNALFSPINTISTNPIFDPFALYTKLIQEQKVNLKVKSEDGLLRFTESADPSYLLILELKNNPFDLATQAQIMPLLNSIKQTLDEQQVSVAYSGLLLHAANGAEQAKFEISTIGIGSLIGITILILGVFRRIESLFLILVPVLVGCLVAISVTSLLFEKVNLITIAFGAGLVGVAVDYSMHFVSESYASSGQRVVRKLFIGLLLGLLSSVLAYGGLALSPFPGLQQMALFSAVGLISAWLTVILWLPFTAPKVKIQYLPLTLNLSRWKSSFPRLERHPIGAIFLIGCVISATLFLVLYATPQDSIRFLQTSPEVLIKEDQAVQKALGNNTNSAFLLVSGEQIESALQEEESLRLKLDSLRNLGELQSYRSITQVLPSQKSQLQNLALVKQLYGVKLSDYFNALQLPGQQKELAQEVLLKNSNILTPENWLELAISEPWRDQLYRHDNGNYSTIVYLDGNLSKQTVAKLKQIAEDNPYIDYANQVEEISNTLAVYRVKVLNWLLIAYGVITVLLLSRYKQHIWRVMLPPIAGSVMALTIAVLINGGYNLFNLVALMLVFGIGLDMGIFLQESRDSAHTWLAVSLSTATSLLAFGLLALSQTPVLYHFGIIVLPGLLLIWLLSPLMQTEQQEKY